MSDDRQHQIDRLTAKVRDLLADDLNTLTDVQAYAASVATRLVLTPSEQAAISQSLGVANVFEHSNVAQRNSTGGDVIQKAQSGGNRFDNAQIDTMGDAVGHDKIAEQHNYYGEPPRSLDAAMQAYYANLASVVSRIPLPDADTADPHQREVLLDDIYTRLEVVSSVRHVELSEQHTGLQRSPEPMRQLSAFEAIQRHRHVMLLGAPGSGKSTVVNGLVWALTCALQGKASGRDFLAREGWQDPTLTPILVNLNRWSQWINKESKPQHQPLSLFWLYLATVFEKDVVEELLRRMMKGQLVIICDGLDEVPADESSPLKRLKSAIYALSETSVARLVVTCRVLDYERPERQILNFHKETLLPFSDELQQEFIVRWYATLGRLGRALLDKPEVLCPKLQFAVQARTDLRRIAGNPLLLTMMALLHASQGELPDKRVKLYSECVNLLLRRWRRFREGTRDRPSLEEYLRDGDIKRDDIHEWGREDTEALLNRIAFTAHSQIQNDDSASGTNMSEDVLMRELTIIFKHYGFQMPAARAEQFCAYITNNDNGILQRHDATIFRFPHRTFQEFLAARYLISDGGWTDSERDLVTRLLGRCDLPEWREVLQLAVSKLVHDGANVRAVVTLLEKLLARNKAGSNAWARNVTIAAELLVEVPRPFLASLGTTEARLWEKVTKHLWLLLDPKQKEVTESDHQSQELIDPAGRVRAGTALGYLIAPELRVKITPDWCDVPAGQYPLGEGSEQQTVTLEGFRISRYPVTNAQYRQFIQSGGYRDQQWWSDTGWQARQAEQWTQPRYWEGARFNGDLQPVVGVSWYEADAFCRWLSAKLNYNIMLPIEAQWEAAARGSQGLTYPWGNYWKEGCANVNEQFGGTTPVVCFASGGSWCGALDLSGNVWEWTASDYTNNHITYRTDIIKNNTPILVRGGSWNGHSQLARTTFRNWSNPQSRNYYLGIRLVCDLE